MYRYKTSQKIFQIGEINIGEEENPTVLIGSIFYKDHKIVKDERRGVFDKEVADGLIKRQEELSDTFGNPCILDVVIPSFEACERYIDFITEVTDHPFIYDAWPMNVRIKGLRYITEVGLSDRIIYNSISPLVKEDEINAIKEAKIKSSIIFSWNYEYPWTEGLLSTLRRLLDASKETCIENIMVDVLAGATIPACGVSCDAIKVIKEEMGLPAGYGPSNATTKWKECKRWGMDIFKACESAIHAASIMAGADFLFYGNIESADHIFPSCAAVDAMGATANMQLGIEPVETHPLYKLFPDVVEEIKKKPPTLA
ncbi:MAG: tetrahydromethanopterin S-methyltransferase subunit H [Candidatus Methylarchaceae archaeon HK01B]|nr:tetrahydromethanopterin S-methyltransferase subunit H [Candidatus Methylarchaceae archaeon HK01B]